MTIRLRLVCALLTLALVISVIGGILPQQFAQAELPKLRVSSDGHYVETTTGEPFLWIGEAVWKMPQTLNREDVEFLLDELVQSNHKYSVVFSVAVMGRGDQSENPTNAYYHKPFNDRADGHPDFTSPKVVAGGDPDNPNDYWDHLDFIVRETKERGLYMVLLPQWSNYYVNGAHSTRIITEAEARSYAEWLGNRYKDENHIMWMMGGDGMDPVDKGTKHMYRAQAEGILKGLTGCTSDCPAYNEADPRWDEVLMLYHGHAANGNPERASNFFGAEDVWMNLDGVYLGYRDYFYVLTDAYNETNPTRPVIEVEGFGFWDPLDYEQNMEEVRAAHYMHYLSGGMGALVLDEFVWELAPGWIERLSIPERDWIGHMKSIMSSVAWYKLVPDKGIVLSANGSGWAEIMSARSSDGDLIMVFFSAFTSGSAQIDLSDITSHTCAQGTWINPVDGSTQDAGLQSTSTDPWFTVPATWSEAMLKLEGVSGPCSTGGDLIPQDDWTLEYVDSEELVSSWYNPAVYAFDGNASTFWHTEWYYTEPGYPHEIQIDLEGTYDVGGLRYLPRQNSENGRIADYNIYVSTTTSEWGDVVASGTFDNTPSEKEVLFVQKTGRYVRLVGTSEVNGNLWASAAEINVLGDSGATPTPEPPGVIPQTGWTLYDVDSYQDADYAGEKAFDGITSTMWHTEWSPDDPVHPHHIDINLGAFYDVSGFRYLPRSDSEYGRISGYEFYVSTDGTTWGTAVGTGTFANNSSEQEVTFTAKTGQYVRLVATSEVNGNPWTSVAEINVLGDSGATPTPTSEPPGVIPQTGWTLYDVDSYQDADYAGEKAFDGITSTMWHTEWSPSDPVHPHHIDINLGASYDVSGFYYYPRQDGENGRIAGYEFYVSTDGTNWGTAVATGTFANNSLEKEVTFIAKTGQYVRLVATSEVNGNPWTTAAEINVLGQ